MKGTNSEDKAIRKAPGLSITARITIWYTVFLVLISALLMGVLFRLYSERERLAAEGKLVQAVTEAGESVRASGENFATDPSIQYYYKDAYISIYDSMSETFVAGLIPENIKEEPPLTIEKVQRAEDSGGGRWHTYDSRISVAHKDYIIRGMISDTRGEGVRSFEQMVFAILLPIVLIMAALGGYLITRSAFAPVRKIIDVTDEIRDEGNLSRRIPLGTQRDEIYELGESFNDMFERIEDMVQREKQFTSDVSHEIRTPISVIQSQSEFALEDPEYGPKALQVINNECRKMTALISNLLMIARSESGRMEPEIETVNLNDLIGGVVEIKRPMANEVGTSLELDLVEGDEMIIETDEGMLTRILLNFVDNAIKYGKQPGGRVLIRARIIDEEFICRVSDNGGGIPEEDRERIWERFYRTDVARSSANSTGLGLAIVSALVAALGGTVRLLPSDQAELGGSTFEFRLPVNPNLTE